MLDHISLGVNDYQESRNFYDNTLCILGIQAVLVMEKDHRMITYYSSKEGPGFGIVEDNKLNTDEFIGKGKGFHVAFGASSFEMVQQWHKKCLELGAKDNGAPGMRDRYGPGYYAAFVIDPNGYRLEAVFNANSFFARYKDHISLGVNDYQESRTFYDNTLCILGIQPIIIIEKEQRMSTYYSSNTREFGFGIVEDNKLNTDEFIGKGKGFHVAFGASSFEMVQQWHKKCLELGAKDNGAPGMRDRYGPGYYAAFVIDPNGYRLEAVFNPNPFYVRYDFLRSPCSS